MQRPLAHENWLGEQVRAGPGTDRQTDRALGAGGARGQRRPWLGTAAQALLLLPEDGAGSSPEQVELDSSSLFPQSLSPSQSQRLGMQRLFLHLKRSEGQVCWSVGRHTQDLPFSIPPPTPLHGWWREKQRAKGREPPISPLNRSSPLPS